MEVGGSTRRIPVHFVVVLCGLCAIAGLCVRRTPAAAALDNPAQARQQTAPQEQVVALQEELRALRLRVESAEGAIQHLKKKAKGQGSGGAAEPADSLRTTGRVPLFGRGPEPLQPLSAKAVVPGASWERRLYGGTWEGGHLGGFTANDTDGQSPALWAWMLKILNVRTLIDVGCGRGISTRWMMDRGVDALCVEGSTDAVRQSLLPPDRIVQHDFGRGAWWPSRTYDVAWAVEFLEHVGRQRMHHYIGIFQKAALVFVTHSTWGGWHHVEAHKSWWWRARFEARGFVYSPELTEMARTIVRKTNTRPVAAAAHLQFRLMVFINPRVASLPEHAHLFGGPGCCCMAGNSSTYVCGASGHDPSMNDHDWLPEQYLPVWAEPTEHDDWDMKQMNGKGAEFRRRLQREGEPLWSPQRKAQYDRRKGASTGRA
eukprot:TRINITY_DN5320_c2_g3_i1.p1 TRINITY_DN5320_c2_g3~~TRINITY_DN5320_c2_g3_i1.p1  ORF type:complete len:429 (+),score=81.35 TRINITY_DN5320_c2_g3_i1:69-1355(+)